MNPVARKLSKLGMGDKTRRNFVTILLVAAGGAIIYGLPYVHYDYYDAYASVYHLTNTQIGVLGSVIGVFGMISYLFGGFLADRVSIRLLLSVSLIGTGLGGFLHLLPLNFTALVALYAFWGFTSLFAFWPACVKAVRVLSSPEDKGKSFGWFEGARGIIAAVMAWAAILAFRVGIGFGGHGGNDDVTGMMAVIVYYSALTVLAGLLVFWKMPKSDRIEDSEKVTFKDLGTVLRMPAVWIIGIVTFCNYVFTMSVYYFTPYGTSLLGMSVTAGAVLAACKRFVTPVSNVGGRYLADKFLRSHGRRHPRYAAAAGQLRLRGMVRDPVPHRLFLLQRQLPAYLGDDGGRRRSPTRLRDGSRHYFDDWLST